MAQESEDPIGFAAIVFWDFALKENEEDVLSGLSAIYGEELAEYGGPYMGGGGVWHHHVGGNDENAVESESDFRSVRTIVDSNIEGLLDVTTIAVLSPAQIEDVIESDYRSGIRNLQAEISGLLEELPTLVDQTEVGHHGVFYAEWAGEEILPDEEIEASELRERIEEEMEVLSSFGFQLSGGPSLVNGRHFVSPTSAMNPYQGLAVIRNNPHPESGPLEEIRVPPAWYSEFSFLQRYYRLHAWGDSRWADLQEIDEKADSRREFFSSLSSSEPEVSNVLEVSKQVQSLQLEYTDFSTRFEAEYRSLKGGFTERADEGTNQFGTPRDVPLPLAEGLGRLGDTEDEPQSVITYLEDNSEHTLQQLDDLYQRVSEKVESIVSAIESRTQLAATDENLRLQNRVRWLTVALLVLTVVLVVLELV